MIEHDVAIVGYGPVGATLANFLGLAGLRVVVLERDTAPYSLPRAVQFDDEVMRVFQTLGLAEAVRKNTRVNPGMRFVNADGKLMLDWSRPMEIGPNGWPASFRFHQPALERTLREGVGRFPESYRCGWASEACDLARGRFAGVTIRLTGTNEAVRARIRRRLRWRALFHQGGNWVGGRGSRIS